MLAGTAPVTFTSTPSLKLGMTSSRSVLTNSSVAASWGEVMGMT